MKKRDRLLLFALIGLLLGDSVAIEAEEPSTQDMETVKQRIVAPLLQEEIHLNRVQALIDAMNPDGSWPSVDYQDQEPAGLVANWWLKEKLNSFVFWDAP